MSLNEDNIYTSVVYSDASGTGLGGGILWMRKMNRWGLGNPVNSNTGLPGENWKQYIEYLCQS